MGQDSSSSHRTCRGPERLRMRRRGCADRPLPNADPCRPQHLNQLFFHPMRGPQSKLLGGFIVFVDDPAAGPRELDGAIDDSGEHCLQVQARADGLADLPQRFQLLHRARQLAGARLQPWERRTFSMAITA